MELPEAEMSADQYAFVQKAMRDSLDNKIRGTESRGSGGGAPKKKGIKEVPENESPEQKLKREAHEALKERVKDKNKELQGLKKLVDDVHAELRQVPRKGATQHAPLGWTSRNSKHRTP